MHEIGITKDLIDSLNKQLKDKPEVSRVKKVFVRLGKATGMTEPSLEFWFGQFSSGTKLADARLDISLVDGKGITIDAIETE